MRFVPVLLPLVRVVPENPIFPKALKIECSCSGLWSGGFERRIVLLLHSVRLISIFLRIAAVVLRIDVGSVRLSCEDPRTYSQVVDAWRHVDWFR